MSFLRRPLLRRLYAVAWVTLASVALLQSSGKPIIGPPQPPGAPDPLRELLLNIAHITTFAGLMVLLWWALYPARRALLVALGFCIIFGFVTETMQSLVPDRGAAWNDLLVNWLASVAVALIIYRQTRHS